MNQRLLIELTQHWTPEQILALYDLCNFMSETLWQQHEDILLAHMMRIDRESEDGSSNSHAQDNLERPFDDPIPF